MTPVFEASFCWLAQIRNHWDKGKAAAATTKAMSEDVFEIIAAAVSLSNSARDRRVKGWGGWSRKGGSSTAARRLQSANGAHEI